MCTHRRMGKRKESKIEEMEEKNERKRNRK